MGRYGRKQWEQKEQLGKLFLETEKYNFNVDEMDQEQSPW